MRRQFKAGKKSGLRTGLEHSSLDCTHSAYKNAFVLGLMGVDPLPPLEKIVKLKPVNHTMPRQHGYYLNRKVPSHTGAHT